MPFDPKQAREAGRKGGKAKAAKRLTLAGVESELGELATLEDAQRWLRAIAVWAAAGLIKGAVASACVRSVEVWVRTHESKLTREVVDRLRARLEQLEAQVKQQRLGVTR